MTATHDDVLTELGELLQRAGALLVELGRRPMPKQREANTNAEMSPRLLNYKRAAAYLGISERSVKQLAQDGEVAKVQIGSRVLFDVTDLNRFVERLEQRT